MNPLYQWARDWGIPGAAIADLPHRLTVNPKTSGKSGTETAAQEQCRLAASQSGGVLWRNNTGVATTQTGSVVRFGLCNDSARVNKQVKSADLIGIRPIIITPEHIGTQIGQFVAREIKRPGWMYSHTDREKAQSRFLTIVASMGGDAAFSMGAY